MASEHPVSEDAEAHPASERLPKDSDVPNPTEDVATEASQSDDASQWGWLEASPGKLGAALGFGVIFGFLLQKGGVAKFDILIGVLLLEDFTVVQVMLSAIIIGMVGTYVLRRLDVVALQINETRLGPTILGGLLFGVGFGLLAYCPGTTAAAVGQGNLDALVGIVGLIVGSYLFALSSRYTRGKLNAWGNRGKITFPDLLGVSEGFFVAIAAPVLVGVLVFLEWYTSG